MSEAVNITKHNLVRTNVNQDLIQVCMYVDPEQHKRQKLLMSTSVLGTYEDP